MYGMQLSYIHIGHIYSISEFKKQEGARFFFMADMHRDLKQHKYNGTALELSTMRYLDPRNNNVFQQSMSSLHAELAFLLVKFINFSSIRKIYSINAGSSMDSLDQVFYPVLMLADVILFSPCTVTVSYDQIHNVRFITHYINAINSKLGVGIFVDFNIVHGKILNIDSTAKMSSSEPDKAIFLLDNNEDKIKKIKTTDIFPSTFEQYEQIENKNIFNIALAVGIELEECISLTGYDLLKTKISRKISDLRHKVSCDDSETLHKFEAVFRDSMRERNLYNYSLIKNNFPSI